MGSYQRNQLQGQPEWRKQSEFVNLSVEVCLHYHGYMWLQRVTVHSDFMAVHRLTSANASYSQRCEYLCA